MIGMLPLLPVFGLRSSTEDIKLPRLLLRDTRDHGPRRALEARGRVGDRRNLWMAIHKLIRPLYATRVVILNGTGAKELVSL
jgi:hypothetical protein